MLEIIAEHLLIPKSFWRTKSYAGLVAERATRPLSAPPRRSAREDKRVIVLHSLVAEYKSIDFCSTTPTRGKSKDLKFLLRNRKRLVEICYSVSFL